MHPLLLKYTNKSIQLSCFASLIKMNIKTSENSSNQSKSIPNFRSKRPDFLNSNNIKPGSLFSNSNKFNDNKQSSNHKHRPVEQSEQTHKDRLKTYSNSLNSSNSSSKPDSEPEPETDEDEDDKEVVKPSFQPPARIVDTQKQTKPDDKIIQTRDYDQKKFEPHPRPNLSSSSFKTSQISSPSSSSSSNSSSNSSLSAVDSDYEANKQSKKETISKVRSYENISVDNLLTFLIKTKFRIKKLFFVGKYYKFVSLVSPNNTYVLLDIGDKFPIPVTQEQKYFENKLIKSVELLELDLKEMFADNLSHEQATSLKLPQIKDVREFNPLTKKNLFEQYKNINISLQSNSKVIKLIKTNIKQFQRLVQCVSKLKYKLALFNSLCSIVISESNDVYAFASKNSNPEDEIHDKQLLFTASLQTFFDSQETIASDIKRIENKFIDVLNDVHSTQEDVLIDHIKNLKNASKVTNNINQSKEHYINTLTEMRVVQTKVQEARSLLVNKFEKLESDKRFTGISAEKSFQSQQIQNEITDKDEFLIDIDKNICKLQKDYNIFCIEIDDMFYNSIDLVAQLGKKLKSLRI